MKKSNKLQFDTAEGCLLPVFYKSVTNWGLRQRNIGRSGDNVTGRMEQDLFLRKPIVSLEELDALLGGGRQRACVGEVDVYYPLKVYLLLGVVLFYVSRLIFMNEETAQSLFRFGDRPEFLAGYLYFRGWFLLLGMAVFVRSYQSGRHLALVCAALFGFSVVSLLFDLFSIYSEALDAPTTMFSIRLGLRVLGIALMYNCLLNAYAAPSGPEKWNPLLAFMKR